MQDKHVVIFRASEDRDIFINKCTLPKTVYQIKDRGEPEQGDIVVGNHQVIDWIIAQHIIDNYDNLPEYTIFTSADPRDHVVSLEIAIHCKFTSGYGSFCVGRSLYSQYTIGWPRIHPSRIVSHLLGLGMVNDNNISKPIYGCQPGTIFYVHRDRILQHPKEMYQNFINWDNDEKLKEYYLNYKHPDWFWLLLSKYNPETKKYNGKEKLEKSIETKMHRKRNDFFGLSMECLWTNLFMSRKEFNHLEKSQAVLGNKLYFNTKLEKYSIWTYFEIPPCSNNGHDAMNNFLLMENSWFDYEDETYIKWRKKLLEKLYYESCKSEYNLNESYDEFWKNENIPKDCKLYHDVLYKFKTIGYKHISL